MPLAQAACLFFLVVEDRHKPTEIPVYYTLLKYVL